MNKIFIQQIKCLFKILLISCSCFSARGGGEVLAQNPKLTLKLHDVRMEQVMNEIEKQINYYFIVDKGVDIKRTLTINVTNKPLTTVLDQLVAGTDTRYRVYQQNIYLSVVKRDASKPVRINGKVLDTRGEPVVGASVVVQGTTLGTSTGLDGAFSLQIPAPAETDELHVNFIGYEPAVVKNRLADQLRHHAPRIRRADRRGCRHGPRPSPARKNRWVTPSPNSAATR